MGFDVCWRSFFELHFANVNHSYKKLDVFFRIISLPAVHHAYIDLNSIIIEAVRSSHGRKGKDKTDLTKFMKELRGKPHLCYPRPPSKFKMFAVIKKIIQKITMFYDGAKPTKTCYIALDGPAQIAKIETRRLRAMDRIKTEAKRLDLYQSSVVSLLLISPGTYFMYHLEKELNAWMKRQSARNPTCQFILNGSTTPGEGELKILQHMHQIEEHADVFLIMSPDSDMYMAALNVRQKQHIYIVRRKESYELISKLDIIHKLQTRHECNQMDRLFADYTFMGLLYGSDFTTKVKYFCSPEMLCSIYEEHMMKTNYSEFLIDMNEKEISLNIKLLNEMLNPYGEVDATDEQPKNLAYYLQSILWILDQYAHGDCKDYMYYCSPRHIYTHGALGKLAQMKPVIKTAFMNDHVPYSPIISTIVGHRNPKIMYSILPDEVKPLLQTKGMNLLKQISTCNVNEEFFALCKQLNELLQEVPANEPETKFAISNSEPLMYVDSKIVPFVLKPLFHLPKEYDKVEEKQHKVVRQHKPRQRPSDHFDSSEPPTKKPKIMKNVTV